MAVAAFKAAIGDNIVAYRAELGLSQKALAAKAGISARYVGQVERGHANPRLLTLDRMAHALGIDVSDLLHVTGSEMGLAYSNGRNDDET